MKDRLIRYFMFFSSLFLFALILPVLIVHLSGCSEALKTPESTSSPENLTETRDIDTRSVPELAER